MIVGVGVVYQVLASDIDNRLPEYATLKAMGYGPRYLSGRHITKELRARRWAVLTPSRHSSAAALGDTFNARANPVQRFLRLRIVREDTRDRLVVVSVAQPGIYVGGVDLE